MSHVRACNLNAVSIAHPSEDIHDHERVSLSGPESPLYPIGRLLSLGVQNEGSWGRIQDWQSLSAEVHALSNSKVLKSTTIAYTPHHQR